MKRREFVCEWPALPVLVILLGLALALSFLPVRAAAAEGPTAARAVVATAVVAGQGAVTGEAADRSWPVAGVRGAPRPVVLGAWRAPPEPWAEGHRGVDLEARPGRPVRAAAPGRVVFAGRVAGRGVVSVAVDADARATGLRTTYEPVRAVVEEGTRVRAGQTVGVLEGSRFHCARPCLHWGLLRGEQYLDPLTLLPVTWREGGPSRLLPVFGIPAPDHVDEESGAGQAGVEARNATAADATAARGRSASAGGPGGGPGVAVALVLLASWGHRRIRRTGPSGGRGPRAPAG